MTSSMSTTGASRLPPEPTDGAHLVTGWEPWLGLDDSLHRRFVHAYAASLWHPVARLGGTVVHDDGWVVHDLRRPAAFENGATLLRPPDHDGWGRLLDELEDLLDVPHGGRVWLWSPWPTPDLAHRGWELAGHPPVMLRPAGPLPADVRPSALTVRPVTTTAELAAWQAVVAVGYPLEGLATVPAPCWLGDEVLDDRTHRRWLAWDGDVAVAAGANQVAHGLNVLAMGATLPAARGRGAWTALARTRIDAAAGMASASLFSDHSRPLAQRLGYVPLLRWTLWTRSRP